MGEPKIMAWRIDLSPYQGIDEGGKELPIDCKQSLVNILFHPDLKLEPSEMFDAKDIADKVRSTDQYVVLDNKEMSHVRKAYRCIRGFPEMYIEFLRRIRDAEQIELLPAPEN